MRVFLLLSAPGQKDPHPALSRKRERGKEESMTYETILVEQRGAVSLVTLNHPKALNALNSSVLAELIQAFAAYDEDEGQRCLVLTGNEKAFAAGAGGHPERRTGDA